MYIQAFGRVTAPQLSHMFQSFKLNSKRNRCLRQCFCSFSNYVLVYVLCAQADTDLLFFLSHYNRSDRLRVLLTDPRCNGHLQICGGNTLHFVLLPDRNISDSIQRFQWVIPEDFVTFQSALRLRPGRGQGNIRRQGEKSHIQRPKTGLIDF